jgi:hypothetical protein
VKDENNNLTVKTITLQLIIDYKPLKLFMVYVTNDNKKIYGLKNVNVKDA